MTTDQSSPVTGETWQKQQTKITGMKSKLSVLVVTYRVIGDWPCSDSSGITGLKSKLLVIPVNYGLLGDHIMPGKTTD